MNYSNKPGKEIKKIGELKKQKDCQITIVTPYYNGGKTIYETANSVFSQTYPFFEWVIVDDGSKDEDSINKLKEIEKLDKRVRTFRKENGGPSVARDYGINQASESSKYIFFLDCDDIMENTMLECLYWTLETHADASFAYTTMVNFGNREFIWEKYLTIEDEKKENLICISSMVRKADLLEVGCFGIKEKAMYEDWNLWLKLLAHGKKPIRVNAPIFWYRISGTGEFSRAKENHGKAMALINGTAISITKEVPIIQYPRVNGHYPRLKSITKNMILPEYEKNNKKNILFIFPWTVVGGADFFNLELIKRLDRKKYNAIVITTIPNDNPLRQDFNEFVSEFYDLSTFLDRIDYPNFVNYIIKSRNIDIVFNSNSKYGYIMLPLIKSKNPNISVIDYIHSVDTADKRGAFGRYTSEFDYCIDKTYTCNNFTTNQLINQFNKENAETLYIGTDEKKFNPKGLNIKELKEKYNLPQDKKIVTFIARLSDEKRPELFVKIAKELLTKRNDLFFFMVGDGPLFNEVKSKIKKYRLSSCFSLPGMIKEKQEELYAVSDITVNCSSLEGLALTSYESLAMGVPVVSTSVGGQEELIDDTVGKIVKFDETKKNKEDRLEEIKEYISAINYVLKNQKRLSENSRKRIVSGFTLNKMVLKFQNIFDNIETTKPSVNEYQAKSVYEVYLELLHGEYEWFCKEYTENKFGFYINEEYESLFCDNSYARSKIIRDIKNFAKRKNVYSEFVKIFSFLKSVYLFLRSIKILFVSLYNMIKLFFVAIWATIKSTIKIILKKR